jgi:hypothetical protein
MEEINELLGLFYKDTNPVTFPNAPPDTITVGVKILI